MANTDPFSIDDLFPDLPPPSPEDERRHQISLDLERRMQALEMGQTVTIGRTRWTVASTYARTREVRLYKAGTKGRKLYVMHAYHVLPPGEVGVYQVVGGSTLSMEPEVVGPFSA